jgi:hypothetical protein
MVVATALVFFSRIWYEGLETSAYALLGEGDP